MRQASIRFKGVSAMLIRIGGVAADGLFQHIGAVVASGIFAAEMRERLIQRRGLRRTEQHIHRIRARAGVIPGSVYPRVAAGVK